MGSRGPSDGVCLMPRAIGQSGSMTVEFSTGSRELDDLLEQVRAGDNVVFYAADPADYAPFVSSLLDHIERVGAGVAYVRSDGLFDGLILDVSDRHTVDLNRLALVDDPVVALQNALLDVGPQPYYIFEPLRSLMPWFGSEAPVRELFLTLCPLLYDLDSVAYWCLDKGPFSAATVAAIRDCTQIFCHVDRVQDDLLITPLKVWGRYSEAMFRPHRVSIDHGIHISPLPLIAEQQVAYTESLAEKSRELAEIRDALSRSNRTLQERNEELAALNERLSEQSRLYQSLRSNLEHLQRLLRAGQDIGSSLVLDQVGAAILAATRHLLDVSACRLLIAEGCGAEPFEISDGLTPEWAGWMACPEMEALRDAVRARHSAGSLRLNEGTYLRSAAVAPIMVRGSCLGTLEAYASGERLDAQESRTLLTYLASEASIALDNAYLYRETQVQGEQLRSFVEQVITGEEQESRRLAFDLHDGLVQIIVASYQHLQTAQAWRGRDPQTEERELNQGVQLLRQAIYEARRLIGQLRPAGLDDLGLVHALQIYVAQLASESGWQVSLEVDPDWIKLSPALEAALFRIVQEATTNARKYAAAERVVVQLRAPGDAYEVTVRDWGKGFDPAALASGAPQDGSLGGRMGLIGIQERARMWGGRCEIDSQPGEGTRVTVRIPKGRALGDGAPAS